MTYSIESAFVRAGAAAAVALQRLIDAVKTAERITRPPRMGHSWEPVPGCPNPADCREYACAGDCSEATEYDEPTISTAGLDQLVGEIRARFPDDETPNLTEPALTPDELVAVRQLIEERFPLQAAAGCIYCSEPPGRCAHAWGSGSTSSAGTGAEPNPLTPESVAEYMARATRVEGGYLISPAAGPVTPAGDSGEVVSPFPLEPASPRPDLATWLEPAVWTALVDHEPHYYENDAIYCCGTRSADWQEWREHVGKPIAAHIAQALLGRRFMETGQDIGASFASAFYPQHTKPNK